MEQVDRALWAVGLGLAPGQEHHWYQPGQTYGKVRWFIAHPIALSGVSRALEIVRVFNLVTSTGSREIHVIVRNTGSNFANYAIWVAQTTGP